MLVLVVKPQFQIFCRSVYFYANYLFFFRTENYYASSVVVQVAACGGPSKRVFNDSIRLSIVLQFQLAVFVILHYTRSQAVISVQCRFVT